MIQILIIDNYYKTHKKMLNQKNIAKINLKKIFKINASHIIKIMEKYYIKKV